MTKHEQGLPDQVAQQLLRRILNKEFPPGAVLPSERDIGETYEVSRPVAREAIKLLAARGIVDVHPRQGATVGLNLTNAAVEAMLLAFHQANVVQEDLLNARRVLEPYIASLAATAATPTQLRQLWRIRQSVAETISNIERGDRPTAEQLWKQADPELHVLIAEMSQNPVFAIFVEVIDAILWPRGPNTRVTMTNEHMLMASQQHAAICDAILERDPLAAQQAMSEHIEYTRQHVFGTLEQLHQPIGPLLD